METAKVSIQRAKSFLGVLIPMEVYINGTHVGNVNNNQTEVFTVPAGHTHIYIQMHSRGKTGKTETVSRFLQPGGILRLFTKVHLGFFQNYFELSEQ